MASTREIEAKRLSQQVQAARLESMDRASILGQSEKLERHIALVEEDLTKQRELVAELLRDGQDATAAMQLLRQFEDLYTRLLSDRDLVRRQLADTAS